MKLKPHGNNYNSGGHLGEEFFFSRGASKGGVLLASASPDLKLSYSAGADVRGANVPSILLAKNNSSTQSADVRPKHLHSDDKLFVFLLFLYFVIGFYWESEYKDFWNMKRWRALGSLRSDF